MAADSPLSIALEGAGGAGPDRPVRVRIAPSPTGDPHVGTAYIALFNLAFARAHGGTFVLRIEDTDQKRSTAASEAAILRSLHWCGLLWDEGPDIGGPFGPYRQSERAEIYRVHAQILLDRGTAYRCFCSQERLDALRASQRAAGEDWRYDGHCRALDPKLASARAEAGEPSVVRLAMPLDGETVVADVLRGEVRTENARVDDQVLLKTDGLPTYHLANVVDDHLMEISHVIRAEEWISSTPKHLQLYAAFGWQPPVFCHMPLLRNADRSKISKRKNPTSLEFYERSGILPEALLNFLGTLGWSMPDPTVDVFGLQDFVAHFDLARVSLGGPVFDWERLMHLNGVWLRRLGPSALASRAAAYHRDGEREAAIAALIAERVPSLGDWHHHAAPFFGAEVPLAAEGRHLVIGSASRKKNAVRLDAAGSAAFLEAVIAGLEAMPAWQAAGIEATLRAVVGTAGIAAGDGFMAVRVAVVGRSAAPGLFETLEVIGKALVLVRLRRAVAFVQEPSALQGELARLEAEAQALRAALGQAFPTPDNAHTEVSA